MIVTKIFDMPKSVNLTKNDIEKFFEQKKIKPVKWSIIGVYDNLIKILISFLKKPL